MARIVEVEDRLQEWALWRAGGTGQGGRGAEMEAEIARLPQTLRATVFERYLPGATSPGAEPVHVTPEWIVSRRLGRIHLLLLEGFRVRDADARLERARVSMGLRETG